jgi:hypothetical protein
MQTGEAMTTSEKIATFWVAGVVMVAVGAVVFGIAKAIMHSREPWFWVGAIAFLLISLWSMFVLGD